MVKYARIERIYQFYEHIYTSSNKFTPQIMDVN